ncbi:MAG: ribosome recycling factor [Candidatus Margulisiibacteriota bacterium]|nr:ribosome recycling factor [Candidatus Margulisiibacteriota bacterium]
MSALNDRLTKTLDNLKTKFMSIRTGRANPDLLSSIKVDYYGASLPIQQLASVSVSDGNTLVVNVFDAGAVSAVEKSIMASDLGLNPQTDGSIIRLRLPDLTEERRNELVKYVKKLSEEGKVALRNIRRDEMDAIKKQDDLSDDDKKRESDSIQKILDQFIVKVDDLVKEKETEIRTI